MFSCHSIERTVFYSRNSEKQNIFAKLFYGVKDMIFLKGFLCEFRQKNVGEWGRGDHFPTQQKVNTRPSLFKINPKWTLAPPRQHSHFLN